MQFGSREYDEPLNNRDTAEWFSSGTTLQTGSNILGDLLGEGDHWEIRDTFHWTKQTGRGTHNFKAGFSVQNIEERYRSDTFQEGLILYLTDDRTLPLAYSYGIGSSDMTVETKLYGVFFNDDWQITPRFTLSYGFRYDYDSDGNNPDFTHPLVPEGRDVDDDNWQPRVAFSYDVKGDGTDVVRGGYGRFTGRYLLIPSLIELQQNGITGRRLRTNINGALLGLPQFALDLNDPENTGLPLAADIALMAPELEAPESDQFSVGWTHRLGDSNLYLDFEGIYVEGEKEIVVRDTNFGGNANPNPINPFYRQINTYTNEGRSEYKAFVASLNGVLRGGHVITASFTLADKKNIADDFSPAFPTGYPDDPADIEGEWGRSRGDERYRFVVSGIFNLPWWNLKLAPIFEYGSGQPWTHRLGYDANGDGKNSDRPVGVARNDEDGPRFSSLSLRLTKSIPVGGDRRIDFIAEAFNLFNTTNYDVNSVDGNEYLVGPSVTNPDGILNPNFGQYRATLDPREIQLGVRYVW